MTTKDFPLVVVVGPTSVGKTEYSIELASQLNGEIISADSRQVYKGLDIGTAKPNMNTRKLIEHDLVDIVDPKKIYNLAQFKNDAIISINAVFSKSKLPILVGGTGQYIWGLLENWDISDVPPNDERRSQLYSFSVEELLDILKDLSMDAFEKVDPKNPRRIVRAIEKEEFFKIHPQKERFISTTDQPWNRILIVGLTLPRDQLYLKIDQRVDFMINSGWIEEVRTLLNDGIDENLPSMSSLGYRELLSYIHGDLSLDTAVERIKFATHRFARGQYNWFRLDDKRINWFDSTESFDLAIEFARNWILSHKSD
ncbi:MAG: tRNA (adenosine(37)-N6)-dimethylallyltransferase MiaA [Chloroflexi bacterium]|nr:tRNA (adenosine(37)-N6)-dimethylallyltransferase MiaA [Chloroflexota bacterium]